MTAAAELAWMTAAVCRDHHPETFFPTSLTPYNVQRAQRICYQCPVIAECGIYADSTHASDGIWAGKVRQPWHQRTFRPVTLQPCGTEAAFWRHKRHGETPCTPCVQAQNAAELARHHDRKKARA